MSDQESDKLAAKARELLDESAEHMDAATRSRLHQARVRALESRRRRMPWYGWATGGVFAASAAFALLVYQAPAQLPLNYADPTESLAVDDMELLEDMEFMAWMILQESDRQDAAS